MRLIYVFLAICFFSCSKDESDPIMPDTKVYVNSITISGSDITSGTTGQMTAIVLPENADDKTIEWSSSDTSIATISLSGLVTALQNGTVKIKAKAMDQNIVYATKDITISSFTVLPTYDYTVSNTTEFLAALTSVTAGETIFLNGGIYAIDNKISLSGSGSSGSEITILGNTEGTRAKLDFSSMPENSSNRGISLEGEYWHIKGIDIYGAGDNGMFISGNNNLIEFCTFSENKDTGLQIGNGASNNIILNCDSFYNADSTLENADGFACKLDAGTGNKFIGCRAWQNLDDGWDGYLRGTDNITTYYENCWAFKNGYLKNGNVGVGDGNGFKTGGSDDKLLKHNAIYKNCVAAGNLADGFDHNSNRGNIELYNCSAYGNGSSSYSSSKNIGFSTSNIANSLIIKNTISLSGWTSDGLSATITDITNNSWQNGLIANSSDFVSLNMDLLSSPRNEDGSLPNIDFMKLVSGSDLIDKGIDVGLPYNGSAPDLGAFEF
jgi:hypothetical protein